jgi:hypothetical protein
MNACYSTRRKWRSSSFCYDESLLWARSGESGPLCQHFKNFGPSPSRTVPDVGLTAGKKLLRIWGGAKGPSSDGRPNAVFPCVGFPGRDGLPCTRMPRTLTSGSGPVTTWNRKSPPKNPSLNPPWKNLSRQRLFLHGKQYRLFLRINPYIRRSSPGVGLRWPSGGRSR